MQYCTHENVTHDFCLDVVLALCRFVESADKWQARQKQNAALLTEFSDFFKDDVRKRRATTEERHDSGAKTKRKKLQVTHENVMERPLEKELRILGFPSSE